MPEGKVTAKSEYAYLMEWHEYYAPKALYTLLKKDLRAKVAMKKFSLEGKEYDYGTIMIPARNQELSSDEVYEALKEIAKDSHLTINAVSTGLTGSGIDLGSNNFSALELPKIAMLVGDGISSYDAGEIWHLFDQRYDMTLTKLDTDNLGRTDLSRYNTMIVPSGRLDEATTKNIQTWVENGGTLIAYRSALNWLKSSKLMELDFKKMEQTATDISFEERGDFRGAQVIGGAIFEVQLDRSHPIAFGYKNDKIAMFRNTTSFLNADKQSYNNPIQYTKNPLLSGYISKPNLDSLALTVPYKSSRLKRGKIVALTDNTNFRAFWYGTNKILMNAIFFREEL